MACAVVAVAYWRCNLLQLLQLQVILTAVLTAHNPAATGERCSG
jgi:hypothetical protein